MKNLKTRILSMLLIFVILASSLVIPSFAAETSDLQYNYAKDYNSGKRHEICTTLNGTSASSYYTGSYTYDRLDDLSASALQSALHTLMTETHHTITSYANCRDMAIQTDCELEANRGVTDTTKQTVVLLYTSYTATRSQWNGWNREHVWPQSLGGKEISEAMGEKDGGADLHHVRPSDAGVNSSRGNKPYNNTSHSSSKYGSNPAKGVLGGYYDSTYFEPLDNVKGDVARICLYVWIRWGDAWGANSITELFPDTDVLLEWMELDPVDTWEMGRNEVVGAIQGNRNVFIDYPELAWLVLGEEIPDDMVTPSGEAKKSAGDPECAHNNTVIKNASNATCTKAGYTGDLRCVDCNMLIAAGSTIPAKGHGETTLKDVKEPSCTLTGHTGNTYCNDCGAKVTSGTVIPAKGHVSARVEGAKDPTCTATGFTGDTYCIVCNVKTKAGSVIAATGHLWSEWVENLEALTKTRTCGTCNEVETVAIEIEVCKHQNTEIKNFVSATCGAEGYTGDTYCKDCGEQIGSGSVISASGDHKYGTPLITNIPTPNQDGEMVYTCKTCGHKKTEVIEYVAPDDEPTDEPIVKPEEPDTQDSYFGESCDEDEELIIAILSKNALYAFLVDWLTKG